MTLDIVKYSQNSDFRIYLFIQKKVLWIRLGLIWNLWYNSALKAIMTNIVQGEKCNNSDNAVRTEVAPVQKDDLLSLLILFSNMKEKI